MRNKDWYTSEKDNRPFFKALLFERDGDLNLGWFLTLLISVVAVLGFIFVTLTGASTAVQLAAWSFMGAAFASVLIASIPIARAKILANASLPEKISEHISNINTD